MKKLYLWGLITLFTAALLAAFVTHWAVYYQQSDFFQQWFTVLLAVDGALIFMLFIAVGWMVLRLILSWRRGERGARISLRLTILFWTMSLLPTVLLYSVSVGAVFRGIELWFDTPLGQSFERGIAFGQDVVGHEFNRLEYVARDIAGDLRGQSGRTAFYIDDVRLFYSLDSIALHDRGGQVLMSSAQGDVQPLSAALAKRVAAEGLYLNLRGSGLDRVVQVAIPVAQGDQTTILLVARALPAYISEGLVEIERGQQEYKKLQILRTGLRWSFILTMSLSLSLILFAVGWISLRLGRNLTRPLVQLSVAAEAVGRGQLQNKLRTDHPMKEIAQLNRSFNIMVSDLEQSRRQVAERQAALGKTNAYLENLLSSLTTGVLTFTADGGFSGYNAAAAGYYELSLETLLGSNQLPPSPLTAAVEEAITAMAKGGEQIIERRALLPDGEVLLVRALSLPAAAGGGRLVMIDDISRQIQVEREATWEEASRRFVHEIKNPLMPIQLAAERLQDKFGAKLSGGDSETLTRLVRTIVNQVSAMQQMVDSFREYADKRRAPPAVPVQLNDLLREVLNLYETRGITLQTDLPAQLPMIQGNAVTLRQLLHNVLGNAADALTGRRNAVIKVHTAAAGRWVKLCIEDNGGGVPAEMLKKLCEPYVTTKPHGTGLGLAVVRKTADEHGGALEIENSGDGLRVTVRFLKI